MSDSLQANWRWLAIAGVIIGIIGLLAILAPFVTGLSISLLVGLFLIASGILNFIGVFSARSWGGAIWQILLGGISIGAGVILFVNPVAGLATLTILVIAYLLVSGVVEIVMGLSLRGEPNWFFAVVSGSIGVLLAIMLWAGFPASAAWAVGVLFGANLLVSGSMMVIFAYSARRVSKALEMDQGADIGGAA
ncbi:HdeD family acid-resistance protein [Haloferax sp. MBLA0078]|uniref:HdeD family acid-resistance protein n=2 Tax=Haloferacaceae TaxID=1644056 RepID=A0A6A8GB89_9EURY|nr:HdeD family acid-resistance protein [Haloferax sp. CBA1150]MRW98167.1 HdeD family acid-resistance protein [Haloferax marinum]